MLGFIYYVISQCVMFISLILFPFAYMYRGHAQCSGIVRYQLPQLYELFYSD